jgi:LuxR family transcriptional regulator, maltose regulon positive regulatory protein
MIVSRGGGVAVTGLLDRERLLSVLDEAVTKRVTVISAPAGSGKTSLLRTWIERARRTHRVVFVSARSEEDEQGFWLALISGLAEAPLPSPSFSRAAMVERVLAELAQRLEPIVLIIDDAHNLTQDALAHVNKLLGDLPAHAHAVVSTRHDLRLGTHRLRLAGELAEIRARNLEFTETETRELLINSGVALSDDAVQTLQLRTEGWAAGLRLAVLSLAVDPDPEMFVAQFSGNNRAVADYLMAEMLERQPADVQRLLLTTSILDRVNGELADLLAQTAGSDRILLELEGANAFVVSLDGERTWFRYHNLFRELLKLELRHTMPALIPDLHRRAAKWFADHGKMVDAIRHLQAAGDWQRAAQRLADQLFELLINGHMETIQALLDAFPSGSRGDYPELALVSASLEIMQGNFADATPHLDIATGYAETLPQERRCAVRVAIATLRLGLARRQGRLDGVIDQLNYLAIPEVAHSLSSSRFNAALSAVAFMNLGVVEVWSGRLAEAERHLREGASVAHKIGQPYLEMICLANLGFASKIHSFAIARDRCKEAIALAERCGWGRDKSVIPALLTLGGTLVWAGEFNEAAAWLERAAEVTSPDANPPIELLLHLTKGMLRAGRGQLHDALVAFEEALRMQSLMLGEHVLTVSAGGWAIATKARLGRLDDARASLADIPQALAASGEIRNAAAVIALESGEPDTALVELGAVLDGRAPVIHDFTIVETHLLAARAHQLLGDDSATWEAIEEALALAERDRLILPFAMTRSRELLERLPRHTTAHTALLLEIVDILSGSSPSPDAVELPPRDALSETEVRVLRYLPTNLSRSDIASELFVSVNTVNTHVRNIYSKLGASNRTEAVDRARRLRLLAH